MREKYGILDIVVVLIMVVAIVVTLYPVLVIVAGSLSDPLLVIQNKVGIIPKGLTFGNYFYVFQMDMIWRSYANTILYTVVGTAFGTVLTVLTAYPLSRKRFVGRHFFNKLIVFTMIFSGGLIPTYLVVRSLGWIETIWAVCIPGCTGAWYVILARTFFESIPDSIEESAKIDGATDFVVLARIILPLSVPIVSTLALFISVVYWNNFFTPLIYLNDQKMYPLALLLQKVLLLGQSESNSGAAQVSALAINYTCIVVATLPIVMVYPFIQKYFTQGIMVGSIKG